MDPDRERQHHIRHSGWCLGLKGRHIVLTTARWNSRPRMGLPEQVAVTLRHPLGSKQR